MKEHVLSPGMQNGDEADLSAEMLGVGRDRAQRLGSRAKQNVVDRALVLQGDRSDGVRYGEDHVEVFDGQEFLKARISV